MNKEELKQEFLKEAEELFENKYRAEAVEDYVDWKPKKGEGYWFIDSIGNICVNTWKGDDIDNIRYEMGNCYRTEEETQKALDKEKLLIELRRFAKQKNAETRGKIDWKNAYQSKHYICRDHHADKHKVNTWNTTQSLNQVYFLKQEHAKEAIKKFGDRLFLLLED